MRIVSLLWLSWCVSARWTPRQALGLALGLVGGTIVPLMPQSALAHGARLTVQRTEVIVVDSHYDSGEPMAHAAVVIYAPNNPSEPWRTGSTDALGRYEFVPDSQLPGEWAVQVRQAGHGDLISFEVGSEGHGTATLTSPHLTPWQQGILALSVIWGLVGTALFFSRSSPHPDPKS